ncbi:amidohydrolase family protein [Oleiharenicola lentus]|uniref:amidohydrolase family protein n=1 Tax=Oleiharenicola lentus TaxID=2508720 RepID=UPI003F67CFA4
MRVIDAHVHLYPPAAGHEPAAWAAARGETHWALLCTRRRKDGRGVQGFPTVDELLRDLDLAGVEKAVLLGWYWENHTTCFEQNRFYAECMKAHPDRLAAFATLHPAAGEAALAEMRWAADAGFKGLGELSPHSQRVSVEDVNWKRVLALAGELKLPVNLHVTDPLSRSFPGRVDTPLADFGQMAREFPQTTFILAHWGGGLAWDERVAKLPNVWFDTAASPLLYGPEVWKKAPDARVLFGSDYPLILYPGQEQAPSLERMLVEASKQNVTADVFGKAAEQLLNW